MTGPSVDPERLAALHRTAFGRTRTAEEERAAAAARRELDELTAPAAGRGPAQDTAPAQEPAPAVGPAPAAAPAPDEAPFDDGAHPPGPRAWLLPAIVALLVGVLVGGVGYAMLTGDGDVLGSPDPGPAPAFTPGSGPRPTAVPTPGPGDLNGYPVEARDWFEGVQESWDTPPAFAAAALGVDPDTTRLALTNVSYSAWVAESRGGGLCLFVTTGTDGSQGACTDDTTFAREGISIAAVSGMTVRWNGVQVYATVLSH